MTEAHIYDSLTDLQIGLLAGYCFDEAWIAHLRNEKLLGKYFPEIDEKLAGKSREDNDYAIAIACAAIEIGERLDKCKKDREAELIPLKKDAKCHFGYASDNGPIQKEMYKQLFGGTCLGVKCFSTHCAFYSKDNMTNFYYVLKLAAAMLAPSKQKGFLNKTLEDIRPDCDFSAIGPQPNHIKKYREETCLSNFCFDFTDELSKIDSSVAEELRGTLHTFAKGSSQIGNYTCIPTELGSYDRLNSRKSGTYVEMLRVNQDGKEIWVNDQFALFAEWIEKEKARDEVEETESSMIEEWKKDMLLNGVWDIYLAAAAKYKEIWTPAQEDKSSPDELREQRLKAFTEYLKLVNKAIEARSRAIAEKLIPNNRETTNE